jgi:glycosyltransferase involved in cell wall biosynthesis
MPRLSVVLPNYNYARYLDERIASILYQSFDDFELIIVDDASTDDSLAVIRSFDDPRIRLVARSENSGKVYASWNEGLTHATAEFVWFAGADDCAERTLVERLIGPMLADPGIGLAHARFLLIDGEGIVTASGISLPPECNFIMADLDRDYVAPPRVDWQRLLITNFIWNGSGVIMRTDAVRAAGGFDDRLLIAADWRLYLEIARSAAVYYTAEPLNAFRQLPKSVSKRMQGALLMDEVYACLSSQAGYVRDDDDRRYAGLGFAIADRNLAAYVAQNQQAGNLDEVRRLHDVASAYRRPIFAPGGSP